MTLVYCPYCGCDYPYEADNWIYYCEECKETFVPEEEE